MSAWASSILEAYILRFSCSIVQSFVSDISNYCALRQVEMVGCMATLATAALMLPNERYVDDQGVGHQVPTQFHGICSPEHVHLAPKVLDVYHMPHETLGYRTTNDYNTSQLTPLSVRHLWWNGRTDDVHKHLADDFSRNRYNLYNSLFLSVLPAYPHTHSVERNVWLKKHFNSFIKIKTAGLSPKSNKKIVWRSDEVVEVYSTRLQCRCALQFSHM